MPAVSGAAPTSGVGSAPSPPGGQSVSPVGPLSPAAPPVSPSRDAPASRCRCRSLWGGRPVKPPRMRTLGPAGWHAGTGLDCGGSSSPGDVYALMGLITTWIHLLAVITHTHTHTQKRVRSLIAAVCGDRRALCVIYALIKWWVIDLPGID